MWWCATVDMKEQWYASWRICDNGDWTSRRLEHIWSSWWKAMAICRWNPSLNIYVRCRQKERHVDTMWREMKMTWAITYLAGWVKMEFFSRYEMIWMFGDEQKEWNDVNDIYQQLSCSRTTWGNLWIFERWGVKFAFYKNRVLGQILRGFRCIINLWP